MWECTPEVNSWYRKGRMTQVYIHVQIKLTSMVITVFQFLSHLFNESLTLINF